MDMKMTKLISVILSLTLAIFLANGFTENLPTGAIARIDTGQKPVNAIAYSRVANRLAVAAAENIHIYDTNTYKELMVLAGHTDSVLALAFSPNGKLLASGGSDETVRLWDAETGKLLSTREEHTGPINAVAFSANGEKFWSGGDKDPAIRSWFSADGGPASKTGFMPTDAFTATAFPPGGETTARAFDVASADEFLVNALLERGAKLKTSLVFLFGINKSASVSGHADAVNVLTLSVGAQTLATGSADKTIQLWNMEMEYSDQPLHILAGHTEGITAMDFSVNGKLLASGSSDKTVRLWDVVTGQHLRTLTGHIGEIGAVTFLGDKALARITFAEAKALASGSSDGTVFIWDLSKIISTD